MPEAFEIECKNKYLFEFYGGEGQHFSGIPILLGIMPHRYDSSGIITYYEREWNMHLKYSEHAGYVKPGQTHGILHC